MKNSEKHPPPENIEVSFPPPAKFLGLHPLIWVVVIVFLVMLFMAHDHLFHKEPEWIEAIEKFFEGDQPE